MGLDLQGQEVHATEERALVVEGSAVGGLLVEHLCIWLRGHSCWPQPRTLQHQGAANGGLFQMSLWSVCIAHLRHLLTVSLNLHAPS
jgi:hypothetical protein